MFKCFHNIILHGTMQHASCYTSTVRLSLQHGQRLIQCIAYSGLWLYVTHPLDGGAGPFRQHFPSGQKRIGDNF